MENNPRVGLGIFILNKDNKVLLVQRISKHATGTWAPPGGWLDFGESLEDGAKREVKEELGIDVEDLEIIGVTNNIYKEEGKHIVGIIFLANRYKGDPKILEPEKHAEFGWFDLGKLPEPIMPPIVQFLASNPECICKSGKRYNDCHSK